MNSHLETLVHRYPTLASCGADLAGALELLTACYEADHVVYLCGNGGSAADCEHVVAELMKSFRKRRKPGPEHVAGLGNPSLSDRLEGSLRAFSLVSQTGLATAFANDVAADLVFAQQVSGYGRRGDVLWALSTSGDSQNLVHAATVARAKAMPVLGLTGRSGGQLAAKCDVCIRVPETETHRVQELHLPVYHALCLALEDHFFPDA